MGKTYQNAPLKIMNIGVTGGMGSGKSMVCKALAELMGAMTVSADILCRELLTVASPGWLAMQKSFPAAFFLEDGQVDRPVLRKAIFSDPEIRGRLDQLLHPLVRTAICDHFSAAKKNKVDLVAEVPLLFEKGWQGDFDYTIVVFAADDICVERIIARDLVSKYDAEESVSSQMPLAEKVKRRDAVIDNSGSPSETYEQLRQLHEKLAGKNGFIGKAREC